MKVLWFANTSCNASEYLGEGPIGGGWLKALDQALQQQVELHVAFYHPKAREIFIYKSGTYYPISKGNWKVKAILGIFWRQTTNTQDLDKYLQIIESVKPDIIHIHGTENAFGCIIPLTDRPVVVSIQGCMTVYHHKFLSGYSLKELSISIFYRGRGLRQFIRNRSFNRAYRDFAKLKNREQQNLKPSKHIIGRTNWDRRISSILAPSSSYYHGDEMLRDAFYTNVWELGRHDELILHTTTSNSTYKGFETICQTLYILRVEKRLDVIWQVAGLKPDDSIVKVTKFKLGSKYPRTGIVFLGSLGETELVESMFKASIYVSPSHIENSPNSLCEAMILGMPCIATYAGGTSSLLEDGKEGILVQDGDPWAMAGSIIELHKNSFLASQYGKNARERALKRHDRGRIVDSYINIYKSICNKE